MKSHVQPPKLLPLHIVGWLSLPWRHWIYLGGVLAFGLCFLMFSSAPFLVRVFVLAIPLLVVFVPAWPLGGLHMDEWLVLAAKFRLQTRPIAISEQGEEEQAGPDLEELLRRQEMAEAAAGQAAPSGETPQQTGLAPGAQSAGLPAYAASGPFAVQTNQMDLTGTYGVLRRSYSTPLSVGPTAARPSAQTEQPQRQGPALAVRPPPRSIKSAGRPMSNAELWRMLFTRLFSGRHSK